MSSPLEGLSEEERALVRPAGPPKTANVMKAVLTDERFSDPNWIYERKLDGVRCIAIRSGRQLRMLSRNDLSLNARYPELADALAAERAHRSASAATSSTVRPLSTERGSVLTGLRRASASSSRRFISSHLGLLPPEVRRRV